MERLEREQQSKLAPAFEELRTSWREYTDSINTSIVPHLEEARRARAELLLAVQKMNRFYAEACDLYANFRSAAHKAGDNPQWPYPNADFAIADFRKFLVDIKDASGVYENIGLMVTAEELYSAYYTGNVPAWVNAYSCSDKVESVVNQ